MSESVIPAVLLKVLSEYKFVGYTLWFASNWPFTRRYQPTKEGWKQTAVWLSAGELPRQPTAAKWPPPPPTRPPHHHADSRQRRRRRTTTRHTDTTEYRTDRHLTTKITEDSTDHAITHHPDSNYTASFSNELRNRGSSCRSTWQDRYHSTSMSA